MFIKHARIAISAAAIVLLSFSGGFARAADTKEYPIASYVDFTGTYADLFAIVSASRESVVRWWNDTRGKELGIKLAVHNFDHKSDQTLAVSLWPTLIAEKPLILFSGGGADALPLRDRLREAGLADVMVGAVFSGVWQPDPYVIGFRSTYAQEAATYFDWVYQSEKRNSPIKISIVSSNASPVYVEMVRGLESYAKKTNRIAIVQPIWDVPQPVDLTAPVRSVVQAGAEYIVVQTTTAAVIAAQRAVEATGKQIPIVVSTHNGLSIAGKAANGLENLEGVIEVSPVPFPVDNSPSRSFYNLLVAKYGLPSKVEWGTHVANSIAQGLLAVRAIETAAEQYGAGNLDSAKVRSALFDLRAKDNFGILPNKLTFDKSAPFPVNGLVVNAAKAKGGKIVPILVDRPQITLEKF